MSMLFSAVMGASIALAATTDPGWSIVMVLSAIAAAVAKFYEDQS